MYIWLLKSLLDLRYHKLLIPFRKTLEVFIRLRYQKLLNPFRKTLKVIIILRYQKLLNPFWKSFCQIWHEHIKTSAIFIRQLSYNKLNCISSSFNSFYLLMCCFYIFTSPHIWSCFCNCFYYSLCCLLFIACIWKYIIYLNNNNNNHTNVSCRYVAVNYLKMWYVVNQNIKLTVVLAANKSNQTFHNMCTSITYKYI